MCVSQLCDSHTWLNLVLYPITKTATNARNFRNTVTSRCFESRRQSSAINRSVVRLMCNNFRSSHLSTLLGRKSPKMEAAGYSETLVSIYKTTWCHTREYNLWNILFNGSCWLWHLRRTIAAQVVYKSSLLSSRIFFKAQQPPVGQGLLIVQASWSHSDTSYSVGLLWTSDQPNAETSTWQHTALTTDRHTCHRRDSNSQTQQASGHRHMP